MIRKKNVSVECDNCGVFTVSFLGKKIVEACPFCGDEVSVKEDDHPLLNSLEALDDFQDYEDFEDED